MDRQELLDTIARAKETGQTTLDLSGNQLSDLPELDERMLVGGSQLYQQ